MSNPYHILGVPEHADQATIRKAYRRLLLKHHPDVNKSEGSTSQTRKIIAAYQALTGDIRSGVEEDSNDDMEMSFESFFQSFAQGLGQYMETEIERDELRPLFQTLILHQRTASVRRNSPASASGANSPQLDQSGRLYSPLE